jgi:hypothetical protein
MADATPPPGPANSDAPDAIATNKAPAAPNDIGPEPAPGLMTAGAPGWYSLVATSFLVCEFNPVGAIGLAAGVGSGRDSPLGWTLTVASFMLALSGFIYAEWRASMDGNRRALAIGSIITIAAGVIPCISAISIPALIAWPIGMMFLITGGSGLRAARKLAAAPVDAALGDAATESEPPAETANSASVGPSISAAPAKRRRKRRRSRNRKPRPPQ